MWWYVFAVALVIIVLILLILALTIWNTLDYVSVNVQSKTKILVVVTGMVQTFMVKTIDAIYVGVYPSRKSLSTLTERFESYLSSGEIEKLKGYFVSKYNRLKEVISKGVQCDDPILHGFNKNISSIFKKVDNDVYISLVELDDYIISLHRNEIERDFVTESLLANNIAQNMGRNFGGFSF